MVLDENDRRDEIDYKEERILKFPNGMKSSLSAIKWGYIIALLISMFVNLPLWTVIIGFCFIYFGNELMKFQKASFPERTEKSSYLIIFYGIFIIILSLINTVLMLNLQSNVPNIAEKGIDNIRNTFISFTSFLVIVQILDIIITLGLAYGLYRFISFIQENLSEHYQFDKFKGKISIFYIAPLGQIFASILTISATIQMGEAFRGLYSTADILTVEIALDKIQNFLLFVGLVGLLFFILFVYSAHSLQKFFDHFYLPKSPPLALHPVYSATRSTQLKYCGSCGTQIPITAKFCVECGITQVDIIANHCDQCRKAIEYKTSICPYCGTWMKNG
ncbi:MAG: double zinc ribbon domain-containing protein [Candidatus Hodarchaeales archaeon]